MQTAAGEQALRILLHIVGDELVHSVGEPDHLRSNIVDEHGTVDAAGVEELEKSLGRSAKLDDLVEVWTLLFHQFQRMGLEHFHGLDVNVAVGNHQWLVIRASLNLRQKNTRAISSRLRPALPFW